TRGAATGARRGSRRGGRAGPRRAAQPTSASPSSPPRSVLPPISASRRSSAKMFPVGWILIFATLAASEASTGRAHLKQRPLESMVAIPAGPFVMGVDRDGLAAAVELCKSELGQQGGCRPDAFAGETPATRV